MKTQDKRGWNSGIKRRVHIVSQCAKYNWKNYVFDNLPANEDDNKSQSIFLHESFQLFDRKVAYLMGYSSFEPFDHKLCGGGARNRTAVRRIPLQVLISVETRTTPI